MNLAFDLDGTLADTKAVVRLAYLQAGAGEHVVDAGWGKPWRQWCSLQVHQRKIECYRKLIPTIQALQLINLFQDFKSFVLTGASAEASQAVCDHIGVRPRQIFPELTTGGKIEILKSMGTGIYYDDDLEACLLISNLTEWTVCHVITPQQF